MWKSREDHLRMCVMRNEKSGLGSTMKFPHPELLGRSERFVSFSLSFFFSKAFLHRYALRSTPERIFIHFDSIARMNFTNLPLSRDSGIRFCRPRSRLLCKNARLALFLPRWLHSSIRAQPADKYRRDEDE